MASDFDKLMKKQVEKLFPHPWRMEWKETNPPKIVADNGRTIAVVTTGTIHGPYDTEVILELSNNLAAPPLTEEIYEAFGNWMRAEHGITEDVALSEFVALMEAHKPAPAPADK
jgi:argonaute-like protein implicated in RNA metabolism and viral defense